jgi:arylsulfatase A-like enzyme
MNNSSLRKTAGAVILFQILFMASVIAHEKPNVLFIAIDDLNDYVNCMNGYIQAHTPNIDRLAAQGILFSNAHCQAPICGPSRASIMTGLHPSSSGNYLQVSDKNIKKSNAHTANSIFMPDYFEMHGYKTMAVGKIYHNGDGTKAFDQYGGRFDWFGPKPPERINYDPSVLPHKKGNTQTDWGAFPEHDSLMTDYKVAEWAVSRLNEQHDAPFFLATGFLRPHVPWHVPQKWFDMFPLEEIALPPYAPDDYNDIPEMGKRVSHAPMMPTTEELIASNEWKKVLQAYLACIAFVDAQVGKVLDALENSPYAENTIVVLWSDHGYHLGEKNRVAKQALWERDTRTVLIFKPLGGSVNERCDQPVQLLDIYPTLLELCDLPPYAMAEGHSLVPLINDTSREWEYPALSYYGVGNIAVRNRKYRLIRYEDGSTELYDMVNDPNEWNNLSDKKKFAHIQNDLLEWVPKEWAPLSKHSKYHFNEYFIDKSSVE